jgi:hypothetical protein
MPPCHTLTRLGASRRENSGPESKRGLNRCPASQRAALFHGVAFAVLPHEKNVEGKQMRKETTVESMKNAIALFVLTTSMTIFAAPAGAEPHGHGGAPDWHEADSHWHGRPDGDRRVWRGDIRHFHEHDVVVWRGGHWVHAWHGGRFGWWWVIPGGWYFYPMPIYPYPDPYVPPAVAVQPAPPVARAQIWYYCDNPAGYYPYVAACSSAWKAVPAVPPALPPAG